MFSWVQSDAEAFTASTTERTEHGTMPEGRILYRPAEAAETLGLSRTRLYQLLAAGEIGSVKIGTSRRIPAAELAAFVDRKRDETTILESPQAAREVACGSA